MWFTADQGGLGIYTGIVGCVCLRFAGGLQGMKQWKMTCELQFVGFGRQRRNGIHGRDYLGVTIGFPQS